MTAMGEQRLVTKAIMASWEDHRQDGDDISLFFRGIFHFGVVVLFSFFGGWMGRGITAVWDGVAPGWLWGMLYFSTPNW